METSSFYYFIDLVYSNYRYYVSQFWSLKEMMMPWKL